MQKSIIVCLLTLFIVFPLFADVWTVRTPPRSTSDPNWDTHVDSDHFSVWSAPEASVTEPQAKTALATLESLLDFYVVQKKFCPMLLTRDPQYKINCCIIPSASGYAFGALDSKGFPAFWLSPEAVGAKWVLGHEFAHSLQGVTGGFIDNQNNFCGWFWECHASWMPHQMWPDNVDCSELYTRMAQLYLGSTRCRYCNWLFLEYLKDHKGFDFVSNLWTHSTNDPIETIMKTGNYDVGSLGDLFADFAAKNVVWDYVNGAVYRSKYGQESAENKYRRYTYLQALDTAAQRYVVPFDFAPQRYGYNIVRLFPDQGAATITVKFRGCVQSKNFNANYKKTNQWEPATIPEPGSDWRYCLVAVTGTAARYGEIKRFSQGAPDVTIDVQGATEAYLVVMAAPTVFAKIQWDQMYYTVYRYPWMAQIMGARPQGFEPVTATGKTFANGGGFVAGAATVASTAYVGPFARVLGGKVQDNARVEGHAVVKGGTVKGNAVIKDYAMVSGGTVSDSAVIAGNAAVWGGTISGGAVVDECANFDQNGTINGKARMGGVCWIRTSATISGTAQMLGDGEINAGKSSGVHYGLIENSDQGNVGNSRTAPVVEVTQPGPFSWYETATAAHDFEKAQLAAGDVRFSQNAAGMAQVDIGMPGKLPAMLTLVDGKGRVWLRTPITAEGNHTFPLPHCTNVLMWRLKAGALDKTGRIAPGFNARK